MYRSTFHGSLRKSPKPTPADLVEEDNTPKAQKTAEESSRPTGKRRPVEEQKRDVTAAVHNDRAKPTKKPTPPATSDTLSKPTPSDNVEQMATSKHTYTTESSITDQGTNKESLNNTPSTNIPTSTSLSASSNVPVRDDTCLLCDEPVDVRIEPCGHTVLCHSHANTAKRCPQCRVCVDL